MKPTENNPAVLNSGPDGAEQFDPVRVERMIFNAVPARRFHLRLLTFLPFGEDGGGAALRAVATDLIWQGLVMDRRYKKPNCATTRRRSTDGGDSTAVISA